MLPPVVAISLAREVAANRGVVRNPFVRLQGDTAVIAPDGFQIFLCAETQRADQGIMGDIGSQMMFHFFFHSM